MLKRSLHLILFLIIIYFCTPAVSAQVEPPSEFESEGVLLMDAGTGELLAAKNEHEKHYPASMTKIMSILLVLEGLEEGRYSLSDMVTISENAAGQVGSRIFLSAGDVVSLEELMIGIAVGSANDATMAVAEYCFGSSETFVNEMNKKAAALGMTGTNFVTPHGLHDDNHYSTPYDVALMSRELLNYPKVHEWFSIWLNENFLAGKIKSKRVYLSNTNQLIHNYSGADGIKTGYTSEARHNISATAKRGDTRFIAVVMDSPSSEIRFREARKLLDFGFANYESLVITEKEQLITRVKVDKGKNTEIDLVTKNKLHVLFEKGCIPELKKEIAAAEFIPAPVAKDTVLGRYQVFDGEGKLLGGVDLIAKRAIQRAGFRDLMGRLFAHWLRFGK